MHTRLKFPLRFKMLLSQLLVVSVVLSLITFTMANLFQVDKTAYIHDLTSTVVLHTAEEANALLAGYRERLKLFGRVLAEPELSGRDQVLQGFFEEFRDFVLVTRSGPGGEQTVYDGAALQAAGVTKEEIVANLHAHPAPESIPAGQVYLVNSTLSRKLPTLTLTISEPAAGGTPVVTTAVLRLDRLQELAKRSRVFDIFLLDSAGRYLAHKAPDRVGVAANLEWWNRVKAPRSSGMTMEYKNLGKEMVGGFSRCSLGGLVVGVEIPKSAAYLTSRELLSDLLLLSLALLGGAALLSQFWSRNFTSPLEKLSEATRMVGQGRFEIEVKAESGDEIGALARSFNQMAAELKVREKALKDLYGQLVHSEKMAAFGSLGAGIAHEVKNPLAGILGITQLSLRGAGAGHPLEKNLLIIEKETKRCKTIIEHLLKFARQEQVEFSEVDLQQVVADALAIVDHQLGINSIKVEQELEPGMPTCRGNANQLQQVLMNLMLNAQQAMSGKTGTVKLSARRLEKGGVELRVADDGPGIRKEIQGKIFDPFFTTKPAGQGTGLGLSVTYGIVKDHGGEIHLESEEGVGTTFIITLPPSAAANG
ncbi:sensor histidine kinase [Citrifermentans bremense]|uniref:sensor histidine kinase n=1 Tax=Citrifermentans bremense TaxID=60035 RepID=UPI00041BFC02|nr:ATP-binding protein [Citrifermentans bremense]